MKIIAAVIVAVASFPADLAALDGYAVLVQPSRITAESMANHPRFVAENFSLATRTTLVGLRFRASLHDNDHDQSFPPDLITVRFLESDGGLPGNMLLEQAGIAVERAATGYLGLLGSREYIYSVELVEPVRLEAGSYFLAISNDWDDSDDSFYWFGGFLDGRRGLADSASFDPNSGWMRLPWEQSLELFSEEMFLLDQRFRVEVEWRTSSTTGKGKPVSFSSNNAGFFWFFSPNNWELLLKVIDGCALNDRYWVFFSATTNVGLTVTVTDTLNGSERVYSNPLGVVADAVADTAAFATCE